MLVTFCASANIKAFMQQQGCPDALRQLLPLVEALLKEDIRGMLMSELLPQDVGEAMTRERQYAPEVQGTRGKIL